MKNLIINILLLFSIIIFGCETDVIKEVSLNSDRDIENSIRAFKINISEPEKYSLKIVNNYHKNVSFRFVLNGNRIYSTIDDIIKDIKKMPDEYPDEPIYRKVWRYTIDNSRHDDPLTDSAFYHIPQIFFNSLGFGYCDDRAMVNNFIWRKLGYESQVWGLGNHVVSEVKVNGKWEMYDSMQEVYYKTKDGGVASVKDIINDPNIILKPKDPVVDTIKSGKNPYKYDIMMCYMHPDAYTVIPELPDLKFQSDFFMGPDYYIQFPGKIKKELVTARINDNKLESQKIDNFSNLLYCITFPSNGLIPFPFFVHDIDGDGKVSFDQKKYYEAGSKELENEINQWTIFNYPVFFNARDTLKIIYLLNPERFSLEKENTLVFYGNDLDSLDINLVRID